MKFEDISNPQIEQCIKDWVHNERNRCIMCRRLIDGLTYQELSEEFNLSITSIKSIVYKNQEKIFKHLS